MLYPQGIENVPIDKDEYQYKIKNTYNNIFSLNYIENWDLENTVIYLHGNIKKYINSYCDISSLLLTHNDIYKKLRCNKNKFFRNNIYSYKSSGR